MKSSQGRWSKCFAVCKPYLQMISLQFGYAGMNILTKFSLNHGMSHYVLVVYRHAFATLSVAPFALFLERPVVDQNFYYAGLKLTSPTFSCAISNMLPAMTFVLAILFRMEKLELKQVRCQAKLIGTLVTVVGAMLMTLYKGPVMEIFWTKYMHARPLESDSAADGSSNWLVGCVFVIVATLAWASVFVLQTATLKRYDAPYSLTTLMCFMGTLQAIVVTFVMERKLSVWSIGWDMNLLAAAYAVSLSSSFFFIYGTLCMIKRRTFGVQGIVTSSMAYYVQALVIKEKGPVFASAFSPLMMIIVAIMGSFILAEKIYLGGLIGAVLIVVGLYSVLWGKYKEDKEKKKKMDAMEIPVAIKEAQGVMEPDAVVEKATAQEQHDNCC
ncbi:hypothetical protein ZIOFF_048718 [Zingiber officinale]|uniref:WAT1-related protein n=1 Tax=Zingiber officinale TaxID=94328 RepID=A0A8J5FRL1_ZINOF|nr:hypothetical protein ZIOFF_048718 [Zingiber officinale]